MFDFLDEQADQRQISDPDVRHTWKSNWYHCALALQARAGWEEEAWLVLGDLGQGDSGGWAAHPSRGGQWPGIDGATK